MPPLIICQECVRCLQDGEANCLSLGEKEENENGLKHFPLLQSLTLAISRVKKIIEAFKNNWLKSIMLLLWSAGLYFSHICQYSTLHHFFLEKQYYSELSLGIRTGGINHVTKVQPQGTTD